MEKKGERVNETNMGGQKKTHCTRSFMDLSGVIDR